MPDDMLGLDQDAEYFQAPDVVLPDADGMVAFSGEQPNEGLADEVNARSLALPKSSPPKLSLREIGYSPPE